MSRCSYLRFLRKAERSPAREGETVMPQILEREAAASQTSMAVPAGPAHQAYLILYVGYAILPIVAGIDKFAHYLANWEMYLSPLATRIVPISHEAFMSIVGGIEIIAGVLVILQPRIGAYVVALWLWGTIANLLLIPGFYDIPLRV